MRDQRMQNRMPKFFIGLCLTLVLAACAPAQESPKEPRSPALSTRRSISGR